MCRSAYSPEIEPSSSPSNKLALSQDLPTSCPHKIADVPPPDTAPSFVLWCSRDGRHELNPHSDLGHAYWTNLWVWSPAFADHRESTNYKWNVRTAKDEMSDSPLPVRVHVNWIQLQIFKLETVRQQLIGLPHPNQKARVSRWDDGQVFLVLGNMLGAVETDEKMNVANSWLPVVECDAREFCAVRHFLYPSSTQVVYGPCLLPGLVALQNTLGKCVSWLELNEMKRTIVQVVKVKVDRQTASEEGDC